MSALVADIAADRNCVMAFQDIDMNRRFPVLSVDLVADTS